MFILASVRALVERCLDVMVPLLGGA